MIASIVTGTAAMTVMATVIALLLHRARARLDTDEDTLVQAINRCLPQTQCAQCGYPGCRPYAEAIAAGEAINRCPPGGEETVIVLADLLGREAIPLDPDCGAPKGAIRAVIREEECIGCTLCIKACPVDAIVGAPQLMHTVIESECTGCELCLPPCPVDCIDLVAASAGPTPAGPVASSPLAAPADCIRCGRCEAACPRELAPQDLFWYRKDTETLSALSLDQCIECRRCDRVCPSEIPLTAIFRDAKVQLREQQAAQARADHAEARFHARERRLEANRQRVKARPSAQEKSALLDTIKQQVR